MNCKSIFLALILSLSACAYHPAFFERAWTRIPTVVLVGSEQDQRLEAAFEAIDFWNRTFAEMGTPFRLGPVTHTSQEVPTNYLSKLSASMSKGYAKPNMPKSLRTIPGDIIIVFCDADLISFE